MTLHEAIIKLLQERNRSMTTTEIANELNHLKWYLKKDGTDITAFQIHGRTKNYTQHFDRHGSNVSLKLHPNSDQFDCSFDDNFDQSMQVELFRIRTDSRYDRQEIKAINDFLSMVKVINIDKIYIDDQKCWSVIVIYTAIQEKAAMATITTATSSDETTQRKPSQTKLSKIVIDTQTPLNQQEQHAYDSLRKWRAEKAESIRVPQFMVASNNELVEVVRGNINQSDDLLKLKGFSTRKVTMFGEEIMAVLNSI